MMLFNRKLFRKLIFRTIPGLILAGIFFIFPLPGLPFLLLPIGLPILFFLRACRNELNFAMPSRLVKSESPVQKSAKIQIPTQLLEPVELEQYKILIEQKAYNGCEADKIKLQEYQRFFEKKEYITGARLADLKDPVTIEGVSKNASWTQMVDKPILTKIFNKETLNEKEVEVQNFLTDRANVITHCYDGYPNRLHHFSVFVRVMLFKFKKPSSEIKNSYLQPRLEI